jgi:hypothetical protein
MATKLLRLMTLSGDIKRRTLDLSTPQPRCLHPARSSSHDFSHPLLNSSPSPPSLYLSIFGMQPNYRQTLVVARTFRRYRIAHPSLGLRSS